MLDFLLAAPSLLARIRSVSFGQYGEDLLLACGLAPRSRGFYVDVGAHHPWRGSNTYKLYVRGWRGLTIEPDPFHARVFKTMRPGDTHLVAGVASAPGSLTMHCFEDRKQNTMSAAQADEFERLGAARRGTVTIECRPLRDIMNTHAPGRNIDLLSVDCEGLDLEVLQSLDWRTQRPSVVLVEDFERFTALRNGENGSAISDLLVGHGYAPISQGVFSFIWVDEMHLRRERASEAFDIAKWQIG